MLETVQLLKTVGFDEDTWVLAVYTLQFLILGYSAPFRMPGAIVSKGATYVTFKQMVSALDRNIDIFVTIQNIQDIPS